jgi:hypothetical protein
MRAAGSFGSGSAFSRHTTAAPYCLQRGKGVYVEKPLTRIASEGKLLYDAKTGQFTNNKEANKFLQLEYRKGWELKV